MAGAIRTLTDEMQSFGKYEVLWDGMNKAGQAAPSGMYLIRLKIGKQVGVRKMLMLK